MGKRRQGAQEHARRQAEARKRRQEAVTRFASKEFGLMDQMVSRAKQHAHKTAKTAGETLLQGMFGQLDQGIENVLGSLGLGLPKPGGASTWQEETRHNSGVVDSESRQPRGYSKTNPPQPQDEPATTTEVIDLKPGADGVWR